MACTSEEKCEDLAGRNIFQFGLLLAALIGHCNDTESCTEVELNSKLLKGFFRFFS